MQQHYIISQQINQAIFYKTSRKQSFQTREAVTSKN